ncbi:putative sulfate exporter family transporter [Coraliomargarita sp. SDUM461003]|uniref:Sulfate exporter family transporter n=1 Tax=Thalassobacterium maritimum TaxID=3041265 RepID=A0ABU1ARA9_9BACT|nr:putative sulfate exporter family transporter [Coraliomargarita sp. SDUM461003]MDQ8206699.1 putative sulfate exporter family transporter [Coraliomargarita sp. SDUM461003]
MNQRNGMRIGAWGIPLGMLAILFGGASGAVALGLGILVAQLGWNLQPERWSLWAHRLLQISIIGLGAGIDLPLVAQAGMDGFGITFVSIALILVFGGWLAHWLRVPKEAGLLICVGTAICGGSAIAAVAGVLRPRSQHTATALAVVFALNAVALLLFPLVGNYLNLSESMFGWWAALAIHDTSSVVGAGLAYGPDALLIATTVKLARSLWIIPVACLASYYHQAERRNVPQGQVVETKARFPLPWFILGFIGMAGLVWLLPALQPLGAELFHWSQRALTVALFLIGVGMVPAMLKQVGWRPLALGVSLWIPTAALSLLALKFWMRA